MLRYKNLVKVQYFLVLRIKDPKLLRKEQIKEQQKNQNLIRSLKSFPNIMRNIAVNGLLFCSLYK